jgi:hypothetical protein
MRPHAEARQSHEKKIQKLKEDVAVIEQKISGEARSAAECVERAANLAPEAATGNQKALSEQVKLTEQKAKHQQQIQNLEAVAAPLRREVATAETELAHMVISEEIEEILEQVADLPALARELSEALAVPVAKFGAFNKRIAAVVKKGLPLLGDRERAQRLEKSLQQSVTQAVRVQLSHEFGAQGISLFATRFAEKNFAEVMTPPLQDFRQALEVTLHTNIATASEGRALFVALTNVSGLFGMSVKTGERISLPIDDPEVQKLIERGAIKKVAEEKGAVA